MTGQLSIDGIPAPTRIEGQFWTPPRLADAIATRFPIHGLVLEPTAGIGNLVRPLAALERVDAIVANELDPRWAMALRGRFGAPEADGEPKVFVEQEDFLATNWTVAGFDWCVMNPPDASKQGIDVGDFLYQGQLVADECIALIRTNGLHCENRFQRVWRHVHIRQTCHLVHRPPFAETGGQQEWSVVWFGHRPGPVLGTTHWPEAWA